jgi:DNA-binding XRE family transcriptional regulator
MTKKRDEFINEMHWAFIHFQQMEKQLMVDCLRRAFAASQTKQSTTIKATQFLSQISEPGEDIEIGARLRKKRKELKLTQKDFAKKLNISQSELSKLEKGKKILSMHRTEKAAKILKTTVIWIFTGINKA